MGAKHFGARVARLEDPALLTGRGRFVDDIRLVGTLHACFVRSPHAYAKIRSIDTRAAAAMNGVHLVATGADLAKLCKPWVGTLDHFRGMKSPPQWPLAIRR